MDVKEFSDAFDTLLNSHSFRAQSGDTSFPRDIVLDEYEKSLFLTKAQEEIVINLYNGKNPFGDSFESTEEMRRYLDSLVKTKTYSTTDEIEGTGVSSNSVFFKLPTDLAFITLEQITYDDDSLGCANGTKANVYPVTQDEYDRVKDNPFRGPTRYKALRLDYGDGTVEIIPKYTIGGYYIKYMAKPSPIVLENLPDDLTINGESTKSECKLNPILHNTILDRAVVMALTSKSVGAKSE